MPSVECFLVEKCNQRSDERGRGAFDVRRVDTGEVIATDTYGFFLGDAPGQVPVGAMTWLIHKPGQSSHMPMDVFGGTEQHLLVVTPGHGWCIDCLATGGGRWTRTGVPPTVTANPSIQAGGYHGWLRDGVLTDA